MIEGQYVRITDEDIKESNLEKDKNLDNVKPKQERRKQDKLNRKVRKYKSNEKFIIARRARQTLNYIINTAEVFPKEYVVLKNNMISEGYSLLRNIYKANILKDINDKKEIIVNIQMLNYYLDEALRRGVISNKKFLGYAKYLFEIDQMVRSWIIDEANR